jgi:hypothetical protein
VNTNKTDAEVLAAVQTPGQCASEQAGFTADEQGHVYTAASEHNAIYYIDTLQSQSILVPMAIYRVPLVPFQRAIIC